MWDMYQKKSDSKNFFKTLGVGDLQVPSVSDFAGESPLSHSYVQRSEARWGQMGWQTFPEQGIVPW